MESAADNNNTTKHVLAERYKTKLCRNFVNNGACPYEYKCMFAHGPDELRTKEMNLRDGLISEEAIKNFKRMEMIKINYRTTGTSSTSPSRLVLAKSSSAPHMIKSTAPNGSNGSGSSNYYVAAPLPRPNRNLSYGSMMNNNNNNHAQPQQQPRQQQQQQIITIPPRFTHNPYRYSVLPEPEQFVLSDAIEEASPESLSSSVTCDCEECRAAAMPCQCPECSAPCQCPDCTGMTTMMSPAPFASKKFPEMIDDSSMMSSMP